MTHVCDIGKILFTIADQTFAVLQSGTATSAPWSRPRTAATSLFLPRAAPCSSAPSWARAAATARAWPVNHTYGRVTVTSLPFFFQNGAKSRFEMWVGPSTFGAGGHNQNTLRRLDSSAKTLKPHLINFLLSSPCARRSCRRGRTDRTASRSLGTCPLPSRAHQRRVHPLHV